MVKKIQRVTAMFRIPLCQRLLHSTTSSYSFNTSYQSVINPCLKNLFFSPSLYVSFISFINDDYGKLLNPFQPEFIIEHPKVNESA